MDDESFFFSLVEHFRRGDFESCVSGAACVCIWRQLRNTTAASRNAKRERERKKSCCNACRNDNQVEERRECTGTDDSLRWTDLHLFDVFFFFSFLFASFFFILIFNFIPFHVSCPAAAAAAAVSLLSEYLHPDPAVFKTWIIWVTVLLFLIPLCLIFFIISFSFLFDFFPQHFDDPRHQPAEVNIRVPLVIHVEPRATGPVGWTHVYSSIILSNLTRAEET